MKEGECALVVGGNGATVVGW